MNLTRTAKRGVPARCTLPSMPDRPCERPVSPNRAVTSSGHDAMAVESTDPCDGKNPAAVALGRLGGLKGGRARAEKLTAAQRSEIARKAALARWKTAGES